MRRFDPGIKVIHKAIWQVALCPHWFVLRHGVMLSVDGALSPEMLGRCNEVDANAMPQPHNELVFPPAGFCFPWVHGQWDLTQSAEIVKA